MTDILAQAEFKISQVLNTVYQKLSKYSEAAQQERDLQPNEEELMRNLNQRSFHYQSLLRVLAIDSYSSAIVDKSITLDQLCGIATAALQHSQQLGDVLKKGGDRKQAMDKFNKMSQCLVVSVKILLQMYPGNTYAEDQNRLIKASPAYTRVDECVIANLRSQNKQLTLKSEQNEHKYVAIQQKLTKLLRQHNDVEKSQGLASRMSKIELKQELAMKQAQIQRMNEEFSFEIQKYNTVFEAMKRQLEQMRGYQNIDLVEQIQLLETEIVRLRQQSQRDQIIIRQLKNDNRQYSHQYSPNDHQYNSRQYSRYHQSRYDY